MQKIVSIDNLARIISKLKMKGKKVVLCHGVFDLLHIGHIKHFEEAKKLGDVLIVTLTSDQYVYKGPGRPAFNIKLRSEAIAALEAIDFVSINASPTAILPIQKIKPHIYCKGPDYKNHHNDVSGQIMNEIKAVKKIGGKIVYTSDITFSSSNLLNKYSNLYSNQQRSIINRIKKKYDFKQIRELIEDFKKIKVLIIGETIIDQYVFCEALGKSGKEPVLVLRDVKMEEYLGGAAAISRHLSQFCKNISLLTMIGEKGEYLKEISKNLPKNVDLRYIKKKNSPTIIKKRFLDNSANNNNKVLGIYTINDEVLSSKDEQLFNNILKKTIPNFDLVIVSDYGHGFISKKSANKICKLSYDSFSKNLNMAIKQIDNIRDKIFKPTKFNGLINGNPKKLRIMHITNFADRHMEDYTLCQLAKNFQEAL